MARKRFQAEQTIRMLREAEVELAKDRSVGVIGQRIGITTSTHYRWRKEYGVNLPQRQSSASRSSSGRTPA